jgi:cytochrome P450
MLLAGGEGAAGARSSEAVAEEALGLLLAGHDTTASALAWTLFLLARHPQAESDVREELGRVLGDRRPAVEDLPRLARLRCALQEALRLYPPTLGVFPREAVADVALAGQRVRRGSLVHVSSFVLHHDARWFPEPERFDPGRFAPGRAERIPPCAYLPFGAGPRTCTARFFAMTEMTLVLACVLQRFRLVPAPGQGEPALHYPMSLRARGGIQLTVGRAVPKASPVG